MRVLLLGGTGDAGLMARALADAGIPATYSYAGRTAEPVAQPLPCRVGGFGGIDGLVSTLQAEAFTHVIDATHPFAAQMSAHAVAACARAGVKLMALERAEWVAVPGDNWTRVADVEAAALALPEVPTRVFLAIGRQGIGAFAGLPQHHYLLRLVDAPVEPLPLPQVQVEVSRGPFDYAADLALMRGHGTEVVVAKNAGGDAARAKIDAAREMGIRVVMIDRPFVPDRPRVQSVAEVMDWLHRTDLGE